MVFLKRKRPEGQSQADVYDGLRQRVLQLTADQLGDAFAEAPILALLMETGHPRAVATLAGVVDGSVSLYFSNGGGSIGAGTHAAVADANARWLDAGVSVLSQLQDVEDPAPPDVGVTQFVVVTRTGLRGASAPERELGEGRHALSAFFYSAQDVITQIR